ncbi:calcium/calmodulin-regulated receptor-like kinase 1 [Manihot esculenta]|nr:calcium/calmodulin-regulated receptor-like kinase 1 [Manihot esculenta]
MASPWGDRRNETRDPNESDSSPEKSPSNAYASDNSKVIGPKSYSYSDLAKATRHFSLNYQIGQGGFGQVFKTSLNGETYAIKKLNNFVDEQAEGKLENEIEVVNRVSHKNLVKLVGYCIDGANRLLILEYFSNGSLRSKLHGKENVLDWKKRMKIAIGSAKGLQYLHEDCEPKIIHLDVKADNILLDDNFESKVSDFGLSLFFSDAASHVSRSSIRGTQIYADPLTTQLGKHSDKSDVYSFGVTLLELISGRKPINQNGVNIITWANSLIEKVLKGEYADFVDSRLQSFDHEEMHRIIFCVNACINLPPKFRPSMKRVVLALEGILPLKNDNKLYSRASYEDEPKPSPKPPIIPETNRSSNEVYKPRRFTYKQLSSATKDFSESNLLYRGIMGEVYMASLNDVGQVIIKKFHLEKEDEFKKIKGISSSVHHENLVNLVGYCNERDNNLLVYECFRFRSSLRFRLLGTKIMSTSIMEWPTIKGIALSIAKGLVHLHELYKPLNTYEHYLDDCVFLDDNLEPKFAEYGRTNFFLKDSEMLLSSSSTTSTYLKFDVYFLGIILLKLITGKQQHNDISSINDYNLIELMAIHLKNNWPKSDYSFVDPRIESYDKHEMDQMIECAIACVNPCPQYRPQMSQVVEVLAGNIPARNLEKNFFFFHEKKE